MDEELPCVQDTSSVSLRLPPSPAGEGSQRESYFFPHHIKTFTSVNIVGGGSANVVLNQMTADVTGLPVYAGPTEGTALGNLAAQMIADGAFADLSAFRKALPESFEIQKYLPRA